MCDIATQLLSVPCEGNWHLSFLTWMYCDLFPISEQFAYNIYLDDRRVCGVITTCQRAPNHMRECSAISIFPFTRRWVLRCDSPLIIISVVTLNYNLSDSSAYHIECMHTTLMTLKSKPNAHFISENKMKEKKIKSFVDGTFDNRHLLSFATMSPLQCMCGSVGQMCLAS